MSPRILHPPVSDLPSALARTRASSPARKSAAALEQADQSHVGRTIALGRPTFSTSVAAASHDDASHAQEIVETPATVPHLRVLGGAVAKSSLGAAAGEGARQHALLPSDPGGEVREPRLTVAEQPAAIHPVASVAKSLPPQPQRLRVLALRRSNLPHEVVIATLGATGSTPAHRILDTTYMQKLEAHNLFGPIDDTAPSTADLARAHARATDKGRSLAYAVFYRRAFEQAYAAGLRGLPVQPCAMELPL